MSNVAFIFPGQGAQFVGMGKSVYDASEKARAVFDAASTVLGYDCAALCFNGPEEKLTETKFSQPAIFTTSMAVLAVLKEHCPALVPAAVLGLSLGEYTALVAAGVLTFEEGILLVKKRAEAMDEVAREAGGSMASVIGSSYDVCKETTEAVGDVWVANLNSPQQIVISGTAAGVEKAMAQLKEKGVKRVIPLKVSGAFHSPLMMPARTQLNDAVQQVVFKGPATVFVPNVTAEPEPDAEKIKGYLLEQLTGTVQWSRSFEKIISRGITEFLEIGPGTVLKGLARKISSDAVVTSLHTYEEIVAYAQGQ